MAKVRTQNGILVRPVQRLYALEVASTDETRELISENSTPVETDTSEAASGNSETVTTRAGRRIKRPNKLIDYE